ncbi:uncharacterized protein CcaverHIS019_0203290 [Cutaneotrichosporon cavernicola]|uniref:Sec63-domain-containing protein n=1 Tax=Cutaneotrichosporon cavernicola TaxID=279322 RepID=A0AA48IA10_9TREE|nr:uncharacterized protein CcaverHIS019_0203290 [Cutaneotrichosporon cavernicola]BEI88967.1 hypothetical protein CcaverHIS019_0203290 [Cutaneotrichosporon cavernicola]BEI96744.1 hypothetical protein CcaverHIS631_0203330 [Cutaneotrichosporon cavernicola]
MSLNDYLSGLLSDSNSTEQWEAYLSTAPALEAESDEHILLDRTPWPTVHSLLGIDAGSNGIVEDLSHISLDTPEPEPQPETEPEPEGDASALVARLHAHLSPGAYVHLMEVLASGRSNEEIQSDLVEILGFEGEGFALVQDILRPGVRRDVIAAEKGGKRKPAKVVQNKRRPNKIDITDVIGTPEDIERRIQEQLNRPKAMFAEEGRQRVPQATEQLPNVFTSGGTVSANMSYGGKLALPVGTEREQFDTFEEVIIPPPQAIPPKLNERPINISELPELARRCFPGYKELNRMQSVVQPTAMGTNENMLVCAPTGAGKTDVAIMSILRVLMAHVRPQRAGNHHPSGFNIDRDAFKIIYVAPMKALAAEITRKFGKRLKWLGIKVAELTGDMQMTRQEINETQIIVTTPEKWDVVTRKPTGEGELASKVRLLIIDEVHLLNEERGAVIETIVARTLRQVESSQSLIRIVGLSATLPNYVDVSDFLRVNRYQGLFFFDGSFRPVPLQQHFIGVKGKARSFTQMRNMDQVVFDKVVEMVREGHQVMVFVHARKETVKTAQKLREMAMEEGEIDAFDTHDHQRFQLHRRDIATSRNKEMKELFDYGFGIHHAGMLRSDRNMMERMFEDQSIKVLCCTATLAWGVNLPAHAVIIKGTQVYDSSRGAFVDLSVLDVLQIFGRAGRPGYETSGVGYICTTQDKLDHYLYQIMSQHPIESKFIPGMVDALNAEVSLGTIANVREAISWIGYTYLFVRMRREPFIYGMSHNEPRDDPQLGNKRSELVTQAARQLTLAKMIRFDELSNSFTITDLGRIAARYYLRHQTVEVFNKEFKSNMKNADIFGMLSQATEFEQIQVRENEIDELTNIMNSDNCPMEVKGGATNKHGKVNILLQAHISKVFIEDFALVSDSAYVAQNAGRIIRALLEIALSRNWANCAFLLIDLSKAIERRMWPYEHPLQQVSLQRDTLYNLRRWADDTEISELRDMDAKEIGQMVHLNEHHGKALRAAAMEFPTVGVQYALRPLANDLLEIAVTVEPTFKWSNKVSGTAEPFYVWVQDADGINILQWRNVLLRPSTKSVVIEFVIPWTADTHASLSIVTASDRWLGSDSQTHVDLSNLVMPRPFDDHTPLLDLPFLTLAALDDIELEQAYRPVSMLNGLQSQAFWSVYHTQHNVLVSAPIASGKSLLAELALWHAFRHTPSALCVVVVPHFRAAAEAAARIRTVVPKNRAIRVANVRTSEAFQSAVAVKGGRIVVATPSAFDGISQEHLRQLAVGDLSTVVFEDLHLLDAVYELTATKILSAARPARVRVVGLACSLSNPSDVSNWLGVEEQFRFNFLPRDRGSPVVVQLKTFTTPHSATLLKTMVKPVYDIVKEAPGNVVVFVPSRAACQTVARDLVTQSGTEMDLNGFLNAQRADVEPLVADLESRLQEPLLYGIGYIVPTMRGADIARVLELFASGIIKVLIAPREACWTLPVRASSVAVMGAQYTHVSGDERMTTNYGRHELVQMQAFAVASAHPAAPGGRMHVLCQVEQQTSISRLLADGLPLESGLPSVLRRDVSPTLTVGGSSNAEAVRVLETMFKARPAPPPPAPHRPRVPDLRKRDAMDMIGWTLLGRRVRANPTFYGMFEGSEAEGLSRMVDAWFALPPQETKKKEKKQVEEVKEVVEVEVPGPVEDAFVIEEMN